MREPKPNGEYSAEFKQMFGRNARVLRCDQPAVVYDADDEFSVLMPNGGFMSDLAGVQHEDRVVAFMAEVAFVLNRYESDDLHQFVRALQTAAATIEAEDGDGEVLVPLNVLTLPVNAN